MRISTQPPWLTWSENMIRLKKTARPRILELNAESWTRELLRLLALGPDHKKAADALKGRYNHIDVKATLLEETAEKCAYCESKFRHVTYGDIEHLVAKNPNPNMTFDWSNLTIACDVCNTKKGKAVVIDPYVVDPETKLLFFGAAVMALPGDHDAEFTVRQLELNRAELVDRRTERLEHLKALRAVLASVTRPDLKAILSEDFDREFDSTREYASLSRSFGRFVKAAESA
jgi:uncharacterized protein (TIGR02646 family)